jgi:hypothetical protein
MALDKIIEWQKTVSARCGYESGDIGTDIAIHK